MADHLDLAKKAFSRGEYGQAASLAMDALQTNDQDAAAAMLLLGRCNLRQDQPGAARDVLLDLSDLTPNDSLVQNELGHAYAALGEAEAAVRAYDYATRLNPALLESWRELVKQYEAIGDRDLAGAARERAEFLERMPKDLRAVASLMHQRKLRKAEDLCRAFLKRFPKNTEGMRLLANIGLELNVLDDAEFLLESALVFRPEFHAARFDYVTVLRKRQKFEPALEQIKKLLETDPDSELYRSTYASICLAVGEIEESLDTYTELVRENPNPLTILHRGHALKTVGQQPEAIRAYRTAAGIKPDFGDAYWSLANLKTYGFEDAEIEQMREREADSSTTLVDRYHLCFALGKALENRESFAASFEYYDRGNALKKSEGNYNPARIESEVERQIDVCDRALFKERKADGWPARDPIFIVGLPRAGSTLLEQILASHPEVDGTFELPNILSVAHKLRGRQHGNSEPRYPRVLREMPADILRRLGKEYIETTRIYRQGAPNFTDKMPNNFRHVGLIKLILPNARIIDARRHPLACCFSVFKQLFAEGQEFSYSLEDIARYYRSYLKVMNHWDTMLPGQICQVRYENVVSDLENEVRRILDYCGLSFDKNCLEFHRTNRAVRTASSEQVRQPIYRSGIEQWKHYAEFLKPLQDALGDAIDRY